MSLFLVVTYYYPRWHYTDGFRGIFVVWMNYLWFFYHLFSISLLARTLFAPWKRLGESYRNEAGGIELEKVAETFVVNGVMRFVGALVRLVTIAVGITAISLTFALGALMFVVWALLPLLIGVFAGLGIFLIFG